MARYLVTGASGFVGSAVTQALLARGDEVWAFDIVMGPALQAMRERLQQMRSTGAGNGSAPMAGAPSGAAGAGGGDRSKRMAERMKQNFSAFRATLKPAQRAAWDAELAALTSGRPSSTARTLPCKKC